MHHPVDDLIVWLVAMGNQGTRGASYRSREVHTAVDLNFWLRIGGRVVGDKYVARWARTAQVGRASATAAFAGG